MRNFPPCTSKPSDITTNPQRLPVGRFRWATFLWVMSQQQNPQLTQRLNQYTPLRSYQPIYKSVQSCNVYKAGYQWVQRLPSDIRLHTKQNLSYEGIKSRPKAEGNRQLSRQKRLKNHQKYNLVDNLIKFRALEIFFAATFIVVDEGYKG